MRSMTGESFWHIKDTLADTCDGFKAFRAFVVAEYSVRSRNAVGTVES